MFGNLSGKQIILFIIGAIFLLYILTWLMKEDSFMKPNRSNVKYGIINTTQSRPIEVSSSYYEAENPAHTENKIKPYTLYNFYSPKCGYSIAFMPAWQQVEKKLKETGIVEVQAVNCLREENSDIVFYYNITSYPTIILKTPSRHIEYDGDRSVGDLYQFVMKNIKEGV